MSRIHAGARLRTRTVLLVTAGALVAASGLVSTTSTAAGPAPDGSPVGEGRTARTESRGFFDARLGTSAAVTATPMRTAARTLHKPATRALRATLGDQALLEIDGGTGTVRVLERLNGFLTPPTRRAPAQVALGYVRNHHAGLGLTTADLRTFHLRRDYRDITGIHHLSWTQRIGGRPVFGNGLQAAVNGAGRLLMVGGSPVSGASAPRATSGRITGPDAAIEAGRRASGERAAAADPEDSATPVSFVVGGRSHDAWQTITMSAAEPTLTVFDAGTGEMLFRRPLANDAKPESTGKAYRYFPGHRPGGTQVPVSFTRKGWLSGRAKILFGNNSHAYSDVNDNQTAQASEEAPPRVAHRWDYRLKPFHLRRVSFCDNPYPCSWNPNRPFSWRTNRKQNVAQVFYFVNSWHDHLLAAPIGFTEAAGNFQRKNSTRSGAAGDYVVTQTDDGANTAGGLPDGAHIDNANMATPPDGKRPRMQMYLQHQPGTTYPAGDPFAPTNVGDEADTVYHEYTHGLSNRLVTDVNGNSTLGPVQAGAMGEAWSDWYAMDYLVAQGLQKDRPDKVDIVMFQYDGAGVALDRTEPMDCRVGVGSPRCNGGSTGHRGGYTYRDYGQVGGSPEVHSDGEIWSQTLWSLRNRLGSRTSEALVTRAMELAPANPSFLDSRNAILLADAALFRNRH